MAEVFEPARSLGWAWLLALTALTTAPLSVLFIPGAWEGEDAVGVWILLAVTVPLIAFFFITLASLPQMRYELAPDALVLTAGPFLTYRVPYGVITDIRRATLTPSLWSSMRLPGLALWAVPYPREGKLFMCATRMSRDILIVSTGARRYGITPRETERFIDALRARMPKTGPPGKAAPWST